MPRRPRALFLAIVLGLQICLIWRSTPRRVGDSAEYVAMAVNLAHAQPPSLSVSELAAAATLFPGDRGFDLVMPAFKGADGRQDFPHFWFYPLLASPLVGGALSLGAHPVAGFTALNLILLLIAHAVLLRRLSWAAASFMSLGPVIWWIDKAHTEVLTFSMIAIAIVLLSSAPWWSILALGAAAAQNPPLAGAMAIAIALAVRSFGWRDRRVWLSTVAGLVLAALHPLYYQARFGVWSGLLRGYVDVHVPATIRELTFVLIDPNVGMLAHDPILLIAAAAALVSIPAARARGAIGVEHAFVAALGALLLVSFSQTTNANSGGTPSPSHYGVWLLPLFIPLLEAAPARALWLRSLAVVSVIWCVVVFPPERPERYLTPTRAAAAIWQRWPGLDNPLAEVFVERVSGSERTFAGLPLATPDCGKVLLAGDGTTAFWPSRCPSAAVPLACQVLDALCYANRTGASYRFAAAPSLPGWRRQLARVRVPRQRIEAPLQLMPSTTPSAPLLPWLMDGWSYVERLPGDGSGTPVEYRWMGDQARLGLSASAPVEVRLGMVGSSFSRTRRLKLSLNGSEITTLTVVPDRAQYDTPVFAVPSGISVLTFEALEAAESPGEGDPRRLSVAVFRLDVVVMP